MTHTKSAFADFNIELRAFSPGFNAHFKAIIEISLSMCVAML